ncbi:MAG: OprO/OprP family phosphate-selective porin [Prevotellaceae bacterium]|nr:OprO/OprP family phosphate-selective porin [Prevotellaceae bacterium]
MSEMVKPTAAAALLLTAMPLLAQPDSAVEKEKSYVPKLEGVVKVKLEESLYGGRARFDVRNSRLGVRGNISESMSYRSQIELSNEGRLSVLDAYVACRLKAVSISLGQQHYAFSADLARSPMQNIFANRTFVAKFATTYADTSGNVRSLGSRDIGGMLTVNLQRWIPVVLKAGLFNGSGVNNPVWQEHLNFSAKAEYGGEHGLQAAASYYSGQTPYAQRIDMWGAELRYIAPKFTVDGEVAQRTYEQGGRNTLTAAYLQGLYRFNLKPGALVRYLAPTVRYDVARNGRYESAFGQFDAQRVSVGMNVGALHKPFKGEVRLNFEKYITSRKPGNYSVDELLHDKVTLEMVVAF